MDIFLLNHDAMITSKNPEIERKLSFVLFFAPTFYSENVQAHNKVKRILK
jgi:hypothetical protein